MLFFVALKHNQRRGKESGKNVRRKWPRNQAKACMIAFTSIGKYAILL